MRWRVFYNWLNEHLFFIICALFVLSVPFSEAFISITTGLIALQIIYPNHLKMFFRKGISDASLWALMGVYILMLGAVFFTTNMDDALYELKKNLAWVLVSPGMVLCSRLTEKKYWLVILLFAFAVTVGTFISTVKVLLYDKYVLDNIREATYISNIVYSLQVVFAIFAVLYARLKNAYIFKHLPWAFVIVWAMWMFAFLAIQKSLTGFVSFFVTAIVFLFWLIKQTKKPMLKRLGFAFMVLVVVAPVTYVGTVVHRYCYVKDVLPEQPVYTPNGNLYQFDTDNKLKENGHYVYWYECPEEIEKEWNAVSEKDVYAKNSDGYPIYSTLVRYLASKGLTKDSAGIAALTPRDVINIENGLSNYIFYEKRFSLYPRMYETVWELDMYFNSANPNNQSFSQRIEFGKAAWYIIKHNFWGVGAGNAADYYPEAYVALASNLDEKFQYMAHNQYLTYMVRYGIPGFAAIVFLLIFAIIRRKAHHNFLLILFLTIIAVSCLGENTLEDHSGLPFFLFFLSLMMWHSPKSEVRLEQNQYF
ncbi:MAG: O-antigen ligase family protein [Prolixibacteraceae bacterium]|nr:O-antigen ligase family protein [Prolixibacteraceae bacterium]MBN2650634.1 O-antigen ligase family protein [Prolixibacteraceae bacterium]